MPGSVRSTSAVLVPTIGRFSICLAVSVALFSPLVSGVSDGSALTVIVSLTPPTFRGIVRSDRLSPACSSMPVNSVLPKPDSSITTV